MPFGLKNTRATYQLLMDKIFEEIIGTNMEVYVDNMVVKSTTVVDHCKALERVFQVLRRHQLKLNLEKCSFGVQAIKFLEFMLTERGIETNPKKCQVIINMRSPWMVKESTETVVPIFNTIRKRDTFAWMTESEEAFLRLKALLASPPILKKLIPGIPLLVYILVVENVVSAVIVQEKEGKQHLVYFISKVLQDAERRYKIVLRKPDLARRMVTWSIQFSEFDISYESRDHIKAQELADFITDMAISGPTIEENNRWFLSMDEASNQSGSGAGVILEGPNGVLIEQSLHFKFKASNNQAEYETLLLGKRLAKELEAKTLTAKSDSKLVTGQLATTQKRGVQRSVIHESISRPTIEEPTVCYVEERRIWMSPLMAYLKDELLPSDSNEAKKIVRDAVRYIIIGRELYKRGFSFPLLHCVEGDKA
ncbi:Retrovirus-related Pol polyprotein from transposon 17.6, partial [Mucuna pruriens]